VLSELKNKTTNIKEKKLIAQDEVYHGALEDILMGQLKSKTFFFTKKADGFFLNRFEK
jgi:hypothetical protein